MMGLGYELTSGAWVNVANVNVANLDLFSDSIISPFGADDAPEEVTYRTDARAVSPDSRERGATRFSAHGWQSGGRSAWPGSLTTRYVRPSSRP